MICTDVEINPKLVPDIYKRLLGDEKIDLVLAGPTRSPVLEKSEKIPLINQADRSSLPSTPMPFRRMMLATSCTEIYATRLNL